MKLSLNWIRDYVDLPENLDISRLSYDITMAMVEVEGHVELREKFNDMVVGVVNEVLPHPDADKLLVCKTDIGGEVKEIVCGGTNLRNGMKVAVAIPGAKVRWHGEGDLVEIKKAKVRGIESYGMICASSEIGLFDLFPYDEETEDGTIVDISDFDAPAGTHLADALGLNDIILEIDNKSLTNRPDLWGHYGIARELSALYSLPFKGYEPFKPPSTNLELTITDTERCPRYIGVKMEGLSVKASPFEIQSRLWRVGIRPINAIVDITNYIMLATGQPTHAFDSDNIKGHITVRRASSNEKLLLLNGKELTLQPEDLVIADNEGPVGLAGVMGGERDSVLPDTQKVILEIANFNALGIRRTASRYEARTEAATRYEKAIDPERADIALSFAMTMFVDLFPEMTVTAFGDVYPTPLTKSKIDVSLDWLARRLGKSIPQEEIVGKLKPLGFEITFNGDNMTVVAPTWRSTGDVSIPDDIMEEVARMYGYENFESVPITTSFEGDINQLEVDIDRKIREYLAFKCGMNEIFSYPWVKDEYLNALFPNEFQSKNMLALSAPPAPDELYIRFSLLPNLCKAVSGNLRFFNEFSIFESAYVFFNRDFSTPYDKKESLPLQRRNVAGACVGSPEKLNEIFRKAKGIIEALPRNVHAEPLVFAQNEKPSWADDVVWLNINCADKQIGNLALLSKKAALGCGIKNSAVMLFEMDIDSLLPFPSRSNEFVHLPEYPMTEYDLSLLVDSTVKWDDILGVIKSKKDELLRGVNFVDEYRGHQIPEGKKSVTFRLTIGSLKKTLTSDEIENYANVVVKRLKKALGVEFR